MTRPFGSGMPGRQAVGIASIDLSIAYERGELSREEYLRELRHRSVTLPVYYVQGDPLYDDQKENNR